MFQEPVADVTLSSIKSPVHSTTVGVLSLGRLASAGLHSEQSLHVLFLANTRSPRRVRCCSWYWSTSVSAGSLMFILSRLR